MADKFTLVDVNGNALSGATGSYVQGGVASGATDSGNPVKTGGVYNSAGITVTNGQRADFQVSSAGRHLVGIGGLYSGADGFTNTNSFVGLSADTDIATASRPGITATMYFNGTTWDRQRGDTNGAYVVPKPVTTGGLSIARLVGSAGANIKASAGQVYSGIFTNTNAAIRYLHLYNKASAATLSTDTPVVTIPLPPNATVQFTSDGVGAAFATGISWTYTTDDIAIPTTAGTTTEIHGTLFYK